MKYFQRLIMVPIFLGLLYVIAWGSPILLGWDGHEEKCLPDLTLALLVKNKNAELQRGDLVFWRPSGPLSYVSSKYVMKLVGGVPGDRVRVAEGTVFINGEVLVKGFPLLDPKADPSIFNREAIIPRGSIFVYGTHTHSNDSRYWGYLPVELIEGKGYEIF